MQAIQITDGRTSLWQWDTGVRIKVYGCTDVDQMHFVTPGGIISRDLVDGECGVPDAALQTEGLLKMYAFDRTENGGVTRCDFLLMVKARPKPADYIDPPDEYDNLEALAERVASLIPGGGGEPVTPEQIQKAVDNYLTENPVQVEETDPTVPGWAKAKQKPSYTAEEVGAQPKGDYALKSDIPAVPAPYTLPVASADTLGGVKVGEGLSIADDGTLRALIGGGSEGIYELIETITLEEDAAILRTQEPDGTPYNFSSMLIKCKAGSTQQTDAGVRFYSGGAMIGYSYIRMPSAGYNANEIYREKGYWRMRHYMPTANANEYEATRQGGNAWLNTCRATGHIDQVNISTPLAIGSTIEIWGVRA